MLHPPRYIYDPDHADSIAALSRLGRSSSGRVQTVGVFRFRGGERVRIDRLDDKSFVATRLDPADRRRSVFVRLLHIVRSLFGLEGGSRWKLSRHDCRAMESCVLALSTRAMQQQERWREWAAKRDRRDASALSRLEALPLPLLHTITSKLSLQDCHAMRLVCSGLAKATADCVPLLEAASWTTLAGLRRAVARALAETVDAPFADPLDRSARTKAMTLAAGRVSVLPCSERCEALCILLDAVERAFPDGVGSAVPLRTLAAQAGKLSSFSRDEIREVRQLAYKLCRALERLPLADRVDAALALCKNPMQSIAERVRALLVPDSCWVLAARVVPPVDRRRVIAGLAGLIAETSRLPPAKAVPMAVQALQLAELDPTASAHAVAALSGISMAAMLTHAWPNDEPGGEGASGTGMAVWEHLLATATAWPTQPALILVKVLLQALSALPDQGVKDAAGLAVRKWLGNATAVTGDDRRHIETLLFPLLPEHARPAAWDALWEAWSPSNGQGEIGEAQARQIATCLWHLPGAMQWESTLLPRLAPLPPQQQAAVLANLPAYLYTGPHTMELFELVVDLAVHHRLLKPLALWYRARTLEDYGQYSDALDSALICLPKAQQAEWIVALSPHRVVPALWIDVGLAALEPPLQSAALQASLLGAVVSQCRRHGVRLDDVWRARVVGLTSVLAPQQGTTADLDGSTVQALTGIADALLNLHDGAARGRKPDWGADAIPAFVDAVWKHVERLPFQSLLNMIANMCVVRQPYHPAFERHFHLTTVRCAMALLPALSPQQQGHLLPMLIEMESGLKGARPVDWRGFDDCRETLWQAIAALPARHRARPLDKVAGWFARTPADAGSRPAWKKARRQYLALVDAMPAEDRPVLDWR